MDRGILRSYVYADLPRAGLGHMLLVWAQALVFSSLNDLPLLVSPWAQFKIGPFLRRERSKRFYFRQFREESPLGPLGRLFVLRTHARVVEPPLAVVEKRRRTLYVFRGGFHWSDYFAGIKEHRELVRARLYAMLSPRLRGVVERLDEPAIGLHVRLSDFRTLRQGEDFAKAGSTRTPMTYFRDVIDAVRAAHGSCLPVTLFSDGHDQELRELLQLPAVTRARASSDLVDLLHLAKSRVIVCSAGSTFGYWSAFLADAPVILHPDHVHQPIRSEQVNTSFYEGGPTGADGAMPELLRENIRAIRWR